ncbi:helix-turn-helix domain-containing protein [Leucobacter coleopterorum]|uniref:Helix-turn-helix domain-containing protein n=1 Tax=Leucobacter coleopterorum TaxID=2714933 RepID=A0ABX6JXC1_9MICO|nr:helix-turn-helix domain-containing protein [Leucobacter coleopterorum]QIM18958.1 helix-turn-helix domain-containing protein [Leucobacter coleopterorum]
MQQTHDAAPAAMRTDDLSTYQRTVDSSFVPLDITPETSGPFLASLRGVGAGDLAFTEVHSIPQVVERTREGISRGGSGYYKVSLLLSGSGMLIQDGREVIMHPGDISFYDTSQPYSLVFGEQFRNLIMMFPKDRLEFPEAFTTSLTAVSLGSEHPLAEVVANFISKSAPHLHLLPASARYKLAHTSLDLFTSVLSAMFDTDAVAQDPHHTMRQRIYDYIRANLTSHELCPGSIAAANYISIRHLHALFQETDTTVSTWIKERRLERCRADLLDPALADHGVATIAASWGFVDAAHFSRNFRAAYGESPTALRQRG